jgi:fumarate hydratase class II
VVTALNPYLGYDEAARVSKRAVAERRPLREVILEEGLLDEATLDKALDVLAMTRGGRR